MQARKSGNRYPIFGIILLFVWALPTALSGQILQDRPELCGTQAPQPVPEGVSAWTDRSNGVSTLTVQGSAGTRTFRLPGVQSEIHEVCHIPGDRLIVFGAHAGYTVSVVELGSGEVVDSFVSYSPTMSPDGRWLAMRAFYPPQTEVPVSEQYTVYDLSATAQANRHGSTPYTSEIAGEPIYPLTHGGEPMIAMDVPDSARHEFRSASFYWSADSRYLTFADGVGKSLSILLVSVNAGKFSSFVHAVPAVVLCAAESTVVERAQIQDTPREVHGEVMVTAKFAGRGCEVKEVTLTMNDFSPATIERHEPAKRKTPTAKPHSGKRPF